MRALDIFRRACNDEEFGIERMPMKRHDDSQRSGRLTVTQPVHHTVPRTPYPVPRTPYPVPRTPYPVPRTPYPVPRTPYPVPRTPYPVPRTPVPPYPRTPVPPGLFHTSCRSLTTRADRHACTQVPVCIALAARHMSPARSVRQPASRSPAPFEADRNRSALPELDRKTERRRCRLMRLAASPPGASPRTRMEWCGRCQYVKGGKANKPY